MIRDSRLTERTRLPREPAVDWPPEWHKDAACLNADMEAFFPSGKTLGSERKRQTAYAKWFCERCPVREICLQENMDVPYGIFGGMTVSERFRAMGWDGNPATRPDRTKYAFWSSGQHYIASGQLHYKTPKVPKLFTQKSGHSSPENSSLLRNGEDMDGRGGVRWPRKGVQRRLSAPPRLIFRW